jgi:MFS family permease
MLIKPQVVTKWKQSFKRYGLVALGFIHSGVSRGLHGTFGVFFVALLDAFGWSRAVTAGAISLAIVFEGICLPAVGSLIDRLGGRKTLFLGGIVLAVGLTGSATISSIWTLYFWVGIVSAAGIGLIGMVPHVAIISREFAQRRATALGIAWSGGGVGIFLLVPAAGLMISKWGWSMAYIGLAVITLFLVIPPVQLFFPSNRQEPAHARPEGAVAGEWTVKRALTNPAFWCLFIARTLASMGNQIIVTHQVAHAVDVGYTEVFAASIFGIMGVVSIFGRLLFGFLSDLFRRDVVFAWVQAVSAVGIGALLLMHDATAPWQLYTYAVFYGLGQGSRALVLSAISADVFQGRHFGAIFGYFTLSIGVGGATGAWLGGYLFDLTHSYVIAFLVSLTCLLVSVVIVWISTRMLKAEQENGRRT